MNLANDLKTASDQPHRIAFIATREPEYSRVSITRAGLHDHFQVDDYVSRLKNYPIRLIVIGLKVIWAWLTLRLRKSDAVFVGFFAQPIFPLVRLLYRGPIIADAYFSLYDTMVNDKAKARSSSLVGRICFWLDRYMLEHAEVCLTDTQQHVEYMKSSFGVKSADVRRLWISAESKPSELRASKPFENEPLRVFFWGGFIPLQGVETIVRAAGLLKQKNINFTIFGAGQTLDACLELKESLGAENLEFCGWQSPGQIPIQAEKSHVALGIFGTTAKAGRVIPNKAFEALAMGIPLITRKSPASDELLVDGQHCFLVEPSNPEALADKILWVRDNYEEACSVADSGRSLFEEVCCPRAVGIQLQEEFRELIAKHQAQTNQKVSSEPVSPQADANSNSPIASAPPRLAKLSRVNTPNSNRPGY